MIVVLPWPDKRLSPNARIHWRAKIDPKRNARDDAAWQAKATEGFPAFKATLPSDGPIPVTITFYPPNRLRRDDDNMIASFKHARDGLALALDTDDRRFKATYVIAEPAAPGRVEVAFQ